MTTNSFVRHVEVNLCSDKWLSLVYPSYDLGGVGHHGLFGQIKTEFDSPGHPGGQWSARLYRNKDDIGMIIDVLTLPDYIQNRIGRFEFYHGPHKVADCMIL